MPALKTRTASRYFARLRAGTVKLPHRGHHVIDDNHLVSKDSAAHSAHSKPLSTVRQMLLSASATAMLQGGSVFMGFIVSVLLARFIGPSGYGRYALAFAWSSILITPSILGLDRFLVRGVATYGVNHQWGLVSGLLRRTNQLVLLTSTTVAIFGIFIALLRLAPDLRIPFSIAMILVPLTALTMLRQGAMQAFGRVVSGQFPEYFIRPILIILGILALEFVGHLTPATALIANVMGVGVAFVVGTILLIKALPPTLRGVEPAFETRRWLTTSLPMMLISGVWMANSYAAVIIVGALDGPSAAGFYTVAQKGAELIVIILFATNMPLAPAVARLYAEGDRVTLEHTVERIARVTLLVSAPIAAAFIAFPDLYLGLFGSGFQTAAPALMILALGQLINAAAGPSGNVLIMTGNERIAVRGVGAGLVANIVLAVLLVPPLGVTGAAIAFATSLVLWNVVLVIVARNRVGINVTPFHRFAIARFDDQHPDKAPTNSQPEV